MAQNYYISGLLLEFHIPALTDNHGIRVLGIEGTRLCSEISLIKLS